MNHLPIAKTRILLAPLSLIVPLFLLIACANTNEIPPETIDLTEQLTQDSEIDRLRYFREIRTDGALKDRQLTGSGVRVTIMGEMVDATHPDLQMAVQTQYNTFSQKGQVLTGDANLPLAADRLGPNDGHGTHIAGTIAAACDNVGIQGVACGATLDVYNLGAYDNIERFPIEGWGNTHDFERFIVAFKDATAHLAQRGVSRITTGSFNLESPAIRYETGGPLAGLSITELVNRLEADVDDIDDLFDFGLIATSNPADREFLTRMIRENDNDFSIALLSLLPQTSTWSDLEDALSAYQATDGVYLVTESNYTFENHSSTLNAMPSLSTKVDEDLWLSIVMAIPEGLDTLDENSTKEDLDALMQGAYITPINSCGELAQDYCLLTPSYSVLSTMTERVAFRDGSPLLAVEGRLHQALDGHSMGAPMVAATLALMEEHNIAAGLGYSMKDLVRILKDNANRGFPGYEPIKHGRGLLDVSAAIAAM